MEVKATGRREVSAGLLRFRLSVDEIEVFLVHPGGPLWQGKDDGAWSIPKGLIEAADKNLLSVAKREYEEETGFSAIPVDGQFIKLGYVVHKSGKVVVGWAFQDNSTREEICSNTFHMQWPPGTGNMCEFPECDEGRFFSVNEASKKINPAQVVFLIRLEAILNSKRIVSKIAEHNIWRQCDT